jgi:hypothetical protein
MKTKLALAALALFMSTGNAAKLTVTCGEGAYDALEQKDLSKAEFVLVLETKGVNNPAKVVSMTDEGNEISDRISQLTYKLPDITVVLKGFDKYEITGLTGCDDLESSTGDIAYSAYVGGFAGYDIPVRAKCNCQK